MKWMSKCDLFAITLPKKLQEGGAPPQGVLWSWFCHQIAA